MSGDEGDFVDGVAPTGGSFEAGEFELGERLIGQGMTDGAAGASGLMGYGLPGLIGEENVDAVVGSEGGFPGDDELAGGDRSGPGEEEPLVIGGSAGPAGGCPLWPAAMDVWTEAVEKEKKFAWL